MKKEDLLEFCAKLGPSYADTPFAKMEKGKVPTIVIKHLKNHKGFAYISEREGKTVLAVKLKPEENEELRQTYPGIITAAYHMSKAHWSDIALTGEVPDIVIERLVTRSYELVRPKR